MAEVVEPEEEEEEEEEEDDDDYYYYDYYYYYMHTEASRRHGKLCVRQSAVVVFTVSDSAPKERAFLLAPLRLCVVNPSDVWNLLRPL